MHSFDQAKAQLQLQAVAERYTGQTAQRGKMCCPFHPDTHPSMQLKNERYRCYVCDAHGDAIDFTARLFHESQAAALTRLAADFALHLPNWNAMCRTDFANNRNRQNKKGGANAPNNPNSKNNRNRPNKAQTPAERKQAAEDIAARKQAAEKAAQAVAEWRQQQALAAAFLQWEDATYTALADMHRTVRDWRRDWAPNEPNTLAALEALGASEPNDATDTLAALDGRIWNPPLRDLCESPSCRGRFHIVPRRGSQDTAPEQTETPDQRNKQNAPDAPEQTETPDQCNKQNAPDAPEQTETPDQRNKQNAPDAPQHPRYLFAIRELDWLRYLLDTLLESEENRINFYKNIKIRKEVYALTEEFERLAHPNRTSRIAEPEHCDAS